MINKNTSTVQNINKINIQKMLSPIIRKHDPSFSRCHETSIIRDDLLRGELSTTAKITENHDYLVSCQDIINSLPNIILNKCIRAIIPEFDEIKIDMFDSEEIKQFIREANCEFLGYFCQHETMEDGANLLNGYINKVYFSPEYNEYHMFIDDIASIVWDIREQDKIGKKWEGLLPTKQQIDTIINNFEKLEDTIKAIDDVREAIIYNASINSSCPICKAAQKKYKYVLKEIHRMRQERI